MHRTLLVMMTLFSLLVQAESAFACQMMDDAGPAKECCCGDKATVPNPDSDQHPDQSPCCNFSLELSVKNGYDDSAPLLLSVQPDYSPPVYAGPSYTLNWSEHGTSRTIWRHDFDSDHSGTQTYLTTLRLRI